MITKTKIYQINLLEGTKGKRKNGIAIWHSDEPALGLLKLHQKYCETDEPVKLQKLLLVVRYRKWRQKATKSKNRQFAFG